MSKESAIQAIKSYISDGYIPGPVGVSSDFTYNGVSMMDTWLLVKLGQEALASLIKADKLILISEGNLNNLKNWIEASRSNIEILESDDNGAANQALMNIYGYNEQIIATVAPYLNLVDNLNYKSLVSKVSNTIDELDVNSKEKIKELNAIKKSLKVTEGKTDRLLRKVSSGVLSENFKNLSNSKWNYLLMTLAMALSIVSFLLILDRSNTLNSYMIESFEKGSMDYRVFIAKWSSMLPYLFTLSVGILELRSRIRNRDIYVYRENVAASIDGYTESLLNRVEDMKSSTERDRARAIVIQFMIDSMLEITKSPIDSRDKQRVGLKIRDIGEATLSNN